MIDSEMIPEKGDGPRLVPAAQLAQWFGVSARTIKNWTRLGILPKPREISPRKHLYVVEDVRTAVLRLEKEQWVPVAGGNNGEAE